MGRSSTQTATRGKRGPFGFILRYLRLAGIFATASVSAQLEYRTNFALGVLGALLEATGALFGLLILLGDGQSLGGWSYYEAAVLVGLFTFIQGMIGGLLRPNLNKMAEAVRTGTMDFTLLKPIDTQFLVSARNVNIFVLPNLLTGLGVMGWALAQLPGVTILSILGGIVLVGAALTIVYAVWFMLTTTAFWFVKVENITELFNGLFRAGQFPVTVFPSWARFLFTFVLPIAFITTVPAEVLLGRIRPASVVSALVVAVGLVVVSRWLWLRAIGSYTSASS
ncbi:MAG: ABC-2 family transporter protein [Chloroflexota bacterium]|nr:ABC-2 family transporter protein [Chloroflexota bacterium]